ncbi:MAG: HAD-IIB family hydrolase [Candidatus Pedobacter colombiensis]|uniref:HAD-IIB family hydrolase n=1 Tax=Candidatus Pedobacter colombiensis TaxID=3121371 RepID=A0AAJ6B7X8_9SPHI|nr:HAD-IIB family hydrolase [Pedobacter sp.]WEK20344.1 MAG: HAD-IIB family hydrolase [Pedobacter sp.]
MKQLIIFDLDGTLAESKAALEPEMAKLLGSLLHVAKVAIISGGAWPQFQKQVLSRLSTDANLSNLSILPTCGTKYYQYDLDWKQLYAENFTTDEKNKIITNLNAAVKNAVFATAQIWGEQIEDRGSQITFSALGQQAPLDAKKNWDPDFARRKIIKAELDKTLPEFSVQMGGATSIDITKPGIDKAYGIHKLRQILKIPIEDMIFIGDALFEGGNDHPARTTGVVCIQVRDPRETESVIEAIIACLDINPKDTWHESI